MKKLITLVMFLCMLSVGFGVARTFDNAGGAGDGNWSTATNWDPEGVPSIDDAVTLGTTPVVADTATISALSITNVAGGGSYIDVDTTNCTTITVAETITTAVAASSTVGVISINAGSADLTINATTITAGVNSNDDCLKLAVGFTGDLTINGNLVGGGSVGSQAIETASAGAITVNGSISGATSDATSGQAIFSSVATGAVVLTVSEVIYTAPSNWPFYANYGFTDIIIGTITINGTALGGGGGYRSRYSN